jgi:hypothetical protein
MTHFFILTKILVKMRFYLRKKKENDVIRIDFFFIDNYGKYYSLLSITFFILPFVLHQSREGACFYIYVKGWRTQLLHLNLSSVTFRAFSKDYLVDTIERCHHQRSIPFIILMVEVERKQFD